MITRRIEAEKGPFLLGQMESTDVPLLDCLVREKLLKARDAKYLRKGLASGKEEVFLLRFDAESPVRGIIAGRIEEGEIIFSVLEFHRGLRGVVNEVLVIEGKNPRQVLRGR